MAGLYKRGLVVWFVAVIYYFYQYVLRVSPSVMVGDWMLAFSLDAKWLGYLVATTTFFYALVQIPIGFFSDLFGARRMILYSILACVLGVGAVAWTENLALAFVGRALIGLGSAAGFICVSKIASEWFPPKQKAFWFAMTMLVGTAGALLGYAPLAKLTDMVGWRQSLMYLVYAGCAVYVLNHIFLKDREPCKHHQPLDRCALILQVKSVFKNRFTWLYAFMALGVYIPISAFADLWGVSFLILKYGLSREEAANILSLAYVGTCGGVLFIAWLHKLIGRVRLIIRVSVGLVALFMGIVLYAPDLSPLTLSIMLMCLGVCVGTEILCFSKACQENDPAVAATITGFLNFVVNIGAAIAQQIVGWVIKLLWDGAVDEMGTPVYRVSDYETSLTIVVIVSVIAFVTSFILPDKNLGRVK
jgi:MFS family permease